MHIYLEATDRSGQKNGLFNYRGESDDYASFKKLMEARGLKVIASKKNYGPKVPLNVLEG